MTDNDETWHSAHMIPISDETDGSLVRAIEEMTYIWKFTNPETDEEFAVPVLGLTFHTKDGNTLKVSLTPGAYATLQHVMADHIARLWGDINQAVADISDEAITRLITDIYNQDGETP